jgi:hypothetical protein
MTACTDTDGVVVAAQYGPRAGVVVVDSGLWWTASGSRQIEQSCETCAAERLTRPRPRSRKAILPAKTVMMLGAGLREVSNLVVRLAQRGLGVRSEWLRTVCCERV